MSSGKVLATQGNSGPEGWYRPAAGWVMALVLNMVAAPVALGGDYRALMKEPQRPETEVLDNQSQPKTKPAALDSDGRPMPVPDAARLGLTFAGETLASPVAAVTEDNRVQSAKGLNGRAKGTVKGPAKGSPRNRPLVADDPGCRWLDRRMSQLEALLASRSGAEHHADELKARRREWRCLKCGREGPDSRDRDRCQLLR